MRLINNKMTMRKIKLFSVLALIIVSISCNKSATEKSVFYEIKGENPCYIFGVLHAEPKNFERLLDAPIRLLHGADLVYFDADVKSDEARNIVEPAMVDWEVYNTYPDSLKKILQEYRDVLFLPQGKELKDVLEKESFIKLQNYYSQHQQHIQKYNERSVWSLIKGVSKLGKEKGKADFDRALFNEVLKDKKPLKGLNSYREIFEPWKSISVENQVELLKRLISNINDLDSNRTRQEQAYLKGDIDLIYKLDSALLPNPANENWINTLHENLYDRKINKILSTLKEEIGKKKLFIVIGASYLGGNKGLIKQLESSGYKLEPIPID